MNPKLGSLLSPPLSWWWIVALVSLVSPVARAAGTVAAIKAEVIANAEVTDDGRKVARPTPEHPAYYVPVILGYHASGEIVAGEKPPSRADVLRQLGRTLAKEGYVLQALRPEANTTRPSLILAIEWGYLNPDVMDFGDDPAFTPADSSQKAPRLVADFNQREMLTLIAGASVYQGAAFTTSEWERLRDAAAEGRYYIVVSAYDFEASLKGTRTLLWRARMSTERQGVEMSDVISALVSGGAPLFGRETKLPQWTSYPVREGRVIIGEAVTKDLDSASPARATPAAPPKK